MLVAGLGCKKVMNEKGYKKGILIRRQVDCLSLLGCLWAKIRERPDAPIIIL